MHALKILSADALEQSSVYTPLLAFIQYQLTSSDSCLVRKHEQQLSGHHDHISLMSREVKLKTFRIIKQSKINGKTLHLMHLQLDGLKINQPKFY